MFFDQGARIYLASAHTDMRKGVDGLFALVKNQLSLDPFANCLFVFYSRRKNRIKILHWAGNGFGVYYRRLEKGTFALPRFDPEQKHVRLSATDLAMLLDGVELPSVKRRPRWKAPGRARTEKSMDKEAAVAL